MIQSYLLNKPAANAQGLASRIVNTIVDSCNENIVDNPLVPLYLNENTKWSEKIIIHYMHEARFMNYKKLVHQLWDQIFKDTPVMESKLIIGNRNNPNHKSRLAHHRPHQHNRTIKLNYR